MSGLFVTGLLSSLGMAPVNRTAPEMLPPPATSIASYAAAVGAVAAGVSVALGGSSLFREAHPESISARIRNKIVTKGWITLIFARIAHCRALVRSLNPES